MAELVERVRAAVMARAAQLLRKDPNNPVDYLVVDLPCTFYMLRTIGCLCSLHAQKKKPGLQLCFYIGCMKTRSPDLVLIAASRLSSFAVPCKRLPCWDSI